jgi:peptide/nickel transport system permease protein
VSTLEKDAGVEGRAAAVWRAWRRTPVNFRIGAAILLIHLLAAVIGVFWTPYGFREMATGTFPSGASWAHPFGVDPLGRDILSRVLHGGHTVIWLALSGTVLGAVLGASLGLLSGYLRGWFDEIAMRVAEALISIPFLILGLLVVSMAPADVRGEPALVILVLGFIYLPRFARMGRAAALDIVTRDYVTIARLRGESWWYVVRRELLPNATGVLLVEFALRASTAPVLVAALGFLGFGLRPPTPEWGLMIAENRQFIVVAPETLLGPALALASLVVGLNLWTEGLARILGRSVRPGAQ